MEQNGTEANADQSGTSKRTDERTTERPSLAGGTPEWQRWQNGAGKGKEDNQQRKQKKLLS